jgi:hypothetical protein
MTTHRPAHVSIRPASRDRRAPLRLVAILAVLHLAGPLGGATYAQEFEWAKRAGGSNAVANGIAVDGAGHTYVTGWFAETATFGLGEASQTTLAAPGRVDVFVAKYSPAGALLWAKQSTGPAGPVVQALGVGIAADGSGNTYVTGWFQQSVTFGLGDTNQTTLVSAGGADLFVAKYTPAGALLWARRLGGTGNDFAFGIAADDAGTSHVMGLLGSGGRFVAKYTAAGTLLWTNPSGGGLGIAVDDSSNAYVTGDFLAAIVEKHDSDGTLLWTRQALRTGDGEGRGIAVDGAGHSLVTGGFSGVATFGQGETNETVLDSGKIGHATEMFVARFDGTGALVWVRQAGGVSSRIAGTGIAVDSAGSSYVAGGFSGAATFGAGDAAETTLTAGTLGSGGNAFIAKYDAGGALVWVRQAHSTGSGSGASGIAIDGAGASHVTGFFRGTATFGLGEANQTTLNAIGLTDIFVAKYAGTSNDPPALDCPTPIAVPAESAAGTVVSLSIDIFDPQGHAFTVRWFIDDALTQTDVVPAGAGLTTVSFERLYAIGARTVTIEADDGLEGGLASCATSVDVNRWDQMITFAPGDRIYGDAPFVLTAVASSGLPVAFTHLAGPAMLDGHIIVLTGAGAVTVQASQAGDELYEPAVSVLATFTVHKGQVAVDVSGGPFTYDGTPHAATGTVFGVGGVDLGPPTFTYDGDPSAPVQAGSYAVTASFGGDENHEPVVDTSYTVVILPADPVVTVVGGSFVYDGLPHPATGTAIGVLGEDLGPLTFAYDGLPDAPVAAGSYLATGSMAASPNYTAVSASSAIDITPKTASVTPDGASKVYGSGDPVFTGTLTGFLAADGVTAGYARTAGETAGPYTISATLDPAEVLSNYAISYNTSAFTIAPAALTIVADDQVRVQGAPSPAFTASAAGFVFGEALADLAGTLAFTTPATTDSPAGTYPIIPSGVSSPNYTIAFVDGTLTILSGLALCPYFETTRAHNAGNTVPVRVRLCNAGGENLSSPERTLAAISITPVGGGAATPAEAAGNANPGGLFRYEARAYMFNLRTTGLASGLYHLNIAVSGDATAHSVEIRIR